MFLSFIKHTWKVIPKLDLRFKYRLGQPVWVYRTGIHSINTFAIIVEHSYNDSPGYEGTDNAYSYAIVSYTSEDGWEWSAWYYPPEIYPIYYGLKLRKNR